MALPERSPAPAPRLRSPLRPLDRADRDAYLEELIPRLVTLRIRAGGARIVWAVPLWPFEEALGFALRLAPLLPFLRGRLPERVRAALPAQRGRPLGPEAALRAWLEPLPRDLLRLPPGEPFASVRTPDAVVEIGQLRPALPKGDA